MAYPRKVPQKPIGIGKGKTDLNPNPIIALKQLEEEIHDVLEYITQHEIPTLGFLVQARDEFLATENERVMDHRYALEGDSTGLYVAQKPGAAATQVSVKGGASGLLADVLTDTSGRNRLLVTLGADQVTIENAELMVELHAHPAGAEAPDSLVTYGTDTVDSEAKTDTHPLFTDAQGRLIGIVKGTEDGAETGTQHVIKTGTDGTVSVAKKFVDSGMVAITIPVTGVTSWGEITVPVTFPSGSHIKSIVVSQNPIGVPGFDINTYQVELLEKNPGVPGTTPMDNINTVGFWGGLQPAGAGTGGKVLNKSFDFSFRNRDTVEANVLWLRMRAYTTAGTPAEIFAVRIEGEQLIK
jgi:hypothetical protein